MKRVEQCYFEALKTGFVENKRQSGPLSSDSKTQGKCQLSVKFLASHAGVFRGARISSLPTNACSTENNIPFSLFYLRGK